MSGIGALEFVSWEEKIKRGEREMCRTKVVPFLLRSLLIQIEWNLRCCYGSTLFCGIYGWIFRATGILHLVVNLGMLFLSPLRILPKESCSTFPPTTLL